MRKKAAEQRKQALEAQEHDNGASSSSSGVYRVEIKFWASVVRAMAWRFHVIDKIT